MCVCIGVGDNGQAVESQKPIAQWLQSLMMDRLSFSWPNLSQVKCLSRHINSLIPERSGCDYINAIFNLVLVIQIFRFSNDNALRWMPPDFTNDKSTMVQVMAWCRQAASHYLSQCWLRVMSLFGITKPPWVKPMVTQCTDASTFVWHQSKGQVPLHFERYRQVSNISHTLVCN